jgi:hypothetical protein
LLVDGDPTPVLVNFNATFNTVERLIFSLRFTAATPAWLQFGGDTALTNGFDLLYNGVVLNPSRIQSNDDFSKYGYDADLRTDESGSNNHVIAVRWSFFKYMPNGLPMWHGESLGIRLYDDMTALASVSGLSCVAQGWR